MDTKKALLCLIILSFVYEFMALETIEVNSNTNTTVRCIENERIALLKFKGSLKDPSSRLSSWVGKDCCKWEGVSCNNLTDNVVKLDLRSPLYCNLFTESEDAAFNFSCLGGELNPSLLDLKFLNYLDLSSNDFKGILIPEFIGSFKNLSHLDLSCASFGGMVPPHLGNLSNLHYLNLDSSPCSFGTHKGIWISDFNWLFGLSSLQYLNLGKVNLSLAKTDRLQPINLLPSMSELHMNDCDFQKKPIPNFLGSLKGLRYLDLSCASFGGMVPPQLGNLSNLHYLNLDSSSCSFEYLKSSWVSDLNWLSGLCSLEYLNLGNVNLSLTSTNWLPAINMLPSLLELHLPNCELDNFPQSLLFINITSLLVIDLRNNTSIPQWLFNITTLVNLDLSNSMLKGLLPEFSWGNLCNLQRMSLKSNYIEGELTNFVDSLSRCSNKSIEMLDLSINKLSGNIPDSLGQLKNMKSLILQFNSFSGSIPASIGKLSSLEELDLSVNKMNGTIPESISQLKELTEVYLDWNSWKGIVSENHFLGLTKLETFQISSSNKSLVLNMKHDWIPTFSLYIIKISDCQLGPTFPAWLQSQKNLLFITLSNVEISDTVPDWLWNLSPQILQLDLSSNQIYGMLPNSLIFGSSAQIDLGNNKFKGSLPQLFNVTDLTLKNNLLSGQIYSNIGQELPTLSNLDLSGNLFTGTIPSSITNMTQLFTLDLSNNHFSGNIPRDWEGMENLWTIDLSRNNLYGEIPSSLCSLPSLSWLKLSSNNLFGELSTSLHNCTRLTTLDLGENILFGNIPKWMGENLVDLSELQLRANMFNGNIPEQLCNLSELHLLDVAHNNLSGPIPPCLGNMTGFKILNYYTPLPPSLDARYFQMELVWKGRRLDFDRTLRLVNLIDLSSNNLRGEIPGEITNLSTLGTLNLSWNQLTGKIPEEIGALQQLETLDLSCNYLLGAIPPSLASITALNYLNLSYNSLNPISKPVPYFQ